MALITEYHTTARPTYSLVEVYDSDAYLDDADAANRSSTEVVAGNGYHLYLRSLQPDIRVKVVIRIWDSPQEPPGTPRASPRSPWNPKPAFSSSTSSPWGQPAR